MIDPKFNELPNPSAEAESEKESVGQAGRNGRPRPGLSINDTIASDANLSVGSRGLDTSGVKTGAGAGGGQSTLTPARDGESPAPHIAPGSRGSGTTLHGESGFDQTPTLPESDARFEGAGDIAGRESNTGRADSHIYTSSVDYDPSNEEISVYAYRCWCERGCPEGSPEEDWNRAERELRSRGRVAKTSAASA